MVFLVLHAPRELILVLVENVFLALLQINTTIAIPKLAKLLPLEIGSRKFKDFTSMTLLTTYLLVSQLDAVDHAVILDGDQEVLMWTVEITLTKSTDLWTLS